MTERLALLITADVRQAVKGFEKVGDAAERELGKTERRLDRTGQRMTSAGAGMVTFGAAALFGLGQAAKAAEEAHRSEVLLQNTLRNSPTLAGESTEAYQELAASIQDKTAADGDEIVAGMATLGMYRVTADELKGLTPLVVDLARKKGIDLVAANQAVGKAMAGNIGALGRMGIQVDKTAYATDRYKAVQDALASSVGGFAQEEGATFAGSLERMKNELGDVVEGVGAGAVDAFTNMFGAVQKATGALDSFSPGAQNAAGQVATYGSVALIAVGATSTLIGQVIKARQNFSAAATAIRNFATNTEGAAGKLGKATTSVAAFTAAFALTTEALNKASEWQSAGADAEGLAASLELLGKQQQFGGELTEKYGADLGGLADAFKDLDRSGLSKAGSAFSDFGVGLRASKSDIDAVDKALAGLVSSGNIDAAQVAYREMTTALMAQGVSTEDIAKRFNDYGQALDTAGVKAAATGGAVDDLAGSTGDAANAGDDFNETMENWTDGATLARDALSKFNDELDEWIDKNLSAEERADQLAGNYQELMVAVAGVKETGHGIFTGQTEEARKYRETMRTVIEGHVAVIQAARENGVTGQRLQQIINAQSAAFVNQAVAMGVPKAEAARYAAALMGIPDNVTTTTAMPGINDRKREVREFRDAVIGVPRDNTIRFHVVADGIQTIANAISNVFRAGPGVKAPGGGFMGGTNTITNNYNVTVNEAVHGAGTADEVVRLLNGYEDAYMGATVEP